MPGTALGDVESALGDFTRSARAFGAMRDTALTAGDSRTLGGLDRRLIRLERAFVDDAGLPGREWYRHVLMAPARSYQPLVLPGLAEALESANPSQLSAQSSRLAAALRRAAAVLDGR